MCGIFGYITNKEEELGPILIEAAQRLTYRGYDSVGAATLNNGKIDLRKDVGKVETVSKKYNIAEMRGQRGITQLRWATFGEPSQVNSQPHLDSDGDMVGAHNGNVVNNVELREQFIAEGMTVRSQNDGETCVHAVERYINRGYEFIDWHTATWKVIMPLSLDVRMTTSSMRSKKVRAWLLELAMVSLVCHRICPQYCR
jgi:glucosamine--fructose-6-phosphate aminotransferase (isomerizing)